jgi:hypothetical protein
MYTSRASHAPPTFMCSFWQFFIWCGQAFLIKPSRAQRVRHIASGHRQNMSPIMTDNVCCGVSNVIHKKLARIYNTKIGPVDPTKDARRPHFPFRSGLRRDGRIRRWPPLGQSFAERVPSAPLMGCPGCILHQEVASCRWRAGSASRKCFDFSLHFNLKIGRLEQANGLTFDHNLCLTSFLD